MSRTEQLDPWAVRAKKHYSVREIYSITRDAARTARHFARLRRERGEQYTERIMLAVTEVNGCALCADGHTRFALDAGLSPDEVRDLLCGVAKNSPDEELPAILFAQHYADTRGHPEPHAWDRLVQICGEREALGVLGAVRMIMWGNALGIPLSSLLDRLRGRPHPDSSLGYETGTLAGSSLAVPLALAHAAVSVSERSWRSSSTMQVGGSRTR